MLYGVIRRAKTMDTGMQEVHISNLEQKQTREGKKCHAITLENVTTGIRDEFLIPINTRNGNRLGNELIDSVFPNEILDEVTYEQIQGNVVVVELVKDLKNTGRLFIKSFRATMSDNQNDRAFDELDFDEF